MKKLCILMSVILFAGAVFAADPVAITGIHQGEKEISGNVSIMKNSGGDSDTTTWMALGSLGYFVTPNVQIKGSGMVFGNKSEDTTTMNGSIGVGADYLFSSKGEMIPYAGGDILLSFSKMDMGGNDSYYYSDSDSSTTETGFGWDIHAGVKQFLSDITAINYEVRYMSDTASDTKWLMFMIGLNIYLQ